MFSPWKAADLFSPCPSGRHRLGATERALSDWAVSEWRTARHLVGPTGVGGGRVVSPASHPRYLADFRALASAQLAAARAVLGLTLGEFTALLTDALGWDVMPETVGAWETECAPPGDVLLFAQAYLAGAR